MARVHIDRLNIRLKGLQADSVKDQAGEMAAMVLARLAQADNGQMRQDLQINQLNAGVIPVSHHDDATWVQNGAERIGGQISQAWSPSKSVRSQK